MVVGEAHRRVVSVACGSRGEKEVDARALLVGCGVDGHRSALSLIRIVGIKGHRFGVVKIDDRTVGHELTVLSLVGHVGEACAGDADAVTFGPVGSFRIDAGSGRNVSDKLGGYRAVIQVLVVVVTGGKVSMPALRKQKILSSYFYLFIYFFSSRSFQEYRQMNAPSSLFLDPASGAG